ncbi:unnamed protein product [Spirodela intermedia]|uniref:Uncharacterized protein n=2 Tax=Spirodela intermedia TaxID=51605 RepID=A0A7I8IIE5_SPIIN|nr:unnamed protein product [Spirodela intermedia]CAA6657641.1 unnamed protein product [Spirodela intermedia]CAA7393732.1 unnamed protein product [Spirodela intermedia]
MPRRAPNPAERISSSETPSTTGKPSSRSRPTTVLAYAAKEKHTRGGRRSRRWRPLSAAAYSSSAAIG